MARSHARTLEPRSPTSSSVGKRWLPPSGHAPHAQRTQLEAPEGPPRRERARTTAAAGEEAADAAPESSSSSSPPPPRTGNGGGLAGESALSRNRLPLADVPEAAPAEPLAASEAASAGLSSERRPEGCGAGEPAPAPPPKTVETKKPSASTART